MTNTKEIEGSEVIIWCATLFKVLFILHWKLAIKSQKLAIFSFLVITFDPIKLLTSSFHSWAAFLELFPGTLNMSIFNLLFMVIINAIIDQNCYFLPFMVFMDTIKMKTNIAILGVPGKSSKNATQLWKLEVNSFIWSKVMIKKLKMASFWLFKANFQCKMNKTLKRVAHQIITSESSISVLLVIHRGICS